MIKPERSVKSGLSEEGQKVWDEMGKWAIDTYGPDYFNANAIVGWLVEEVARLRKKIDETRTKI